MLEYIIAGIVGSAALTLFVVRLSLKTFVQASIEESIRHGFAAERERLRHELDLHRQELQHQFQSELDRLNREDKFRLVALERRMEVHQQAFKLALEMSHNIHATETEKMALLNKCEEFWCSSALYLVEEAREGFRGAMHNLSAYAVWLQTWRDDPRDPENTKTVKAAFDNIQQLPPRLLAIVDRESSGKSNYMIDQSVSPFEKTPPKEDRPVPTRGT